MARWRIGGILLLLGSLASAAAADEVHRIGVGLHYWETVDDLVDEGFELEESGFSQLVTYQYRPSSLLGFELAVEYFPDGFGGSDETAYSPMALVLIGSSLYGAVGVGVTVSSGIEGDVSDPFWVARVGWDLELIPRVHVDLNVNYQFGAFSELGEADTDTVTLGAALRFGF